MIETNEYCSACSRKDERISRLTYEREKLVDTVKQLEHELSVMRSSHNLLYNVHNGEY